MKTDWFVKVDCPKPSKKAHSSGDHVKICSDCPYTIWEKPEPVAGFMNSMSGVRVGSIGMAAELDDIGEELLDIERFTKSESDALSKLRTLRQIRSHAEHTGWRIDALNLDDTLKHLDGLIEFCEKAEKKRLHIIAWA